MPDTYCRHDRASWAAEVASGSSKLLDTHVDVRQTTTHELEPDASRPLRARSVLFFLSRPAAVPIGLRQAE